MLTADKRNLSFRRRRISPMHTFTESVPKHSMRWSIKLERATTSSLTPAVPTSVELLRPILQHRQLDFLTVRS